MTHTKAKYPALPEALSKNASYYISRVIIALNHPGKKHWREKLNGCLMITDLAKSGANDEALVRQLEPLKAALNKCKAVTKPVREAAAEAIAELEKKKAESMARNEEGEEGEGGDKPEEQEVTVHDADEPPPIKFEPDYEPEITGGGGGGVEDDDDDDSVVSPTRDGAGYRGKKGESLESVKKKGRKAKYAHQRVAGGVRSPRENETASGSAHATVRMLKELGNKSVALQRSLDDMARGVGDKMDNIGRRVKNLEVEVVGGGGGGAGEGGWRGGREGSRKYVSKSHRRRILIKTTLTPRNSSSSSRRTRSSSSSRARASTSISPSTTRRCRCGGRSNGCCTLGNSRPRTRRRATRTTRWCCSDS